MNNDQLKNTEKNGPDNNPICFVAGKSGGHIIPCITLAKNEYPDKKILFFSSDLPLDNIIISHEPMITTHVRLPLRYFSFKQWYLWPRYLWQASLSFFRALRWLIKQKPSKVITTGSVTAIPVCIAAKLVSIPVIVYELNAEPGKVTRFLAPFAQTIYSPFSTLKKNFDASKVAIKPYPIAFSNADKKQSSPDLYKTYNLSPDKKTIFILGGSQGSQYLNQLITKVITKKVLPVTDIQVIHQTGKDKARDINLWYQKNNVQAHVFSFDHNIAPLYTMADLIICRAGAGTLFEVAFFEKPCITIPLEATTTQHQCGNAKAIAQEYADLFSVFTHEQIENNFDEFAQHMAQKINLSLISQTQFDESQASQ